MRLDQLTFLIDLNDVERDDTTVVSFDFTSNYGPGTTVRTDDAPRAGSHVRLIDDQGSTYDAEVIEIKTPRDMVVRVDWGSETPRIDVPRWTTLDDESVIQVRGWSCSTPVTAASGTRPLMEASPLAVWAQLILADAADAVNGKLYLIGGGWTRIAPDVAATIALAGLVHIPYSNTNTRYTVQLCLLTDDNEPWPAEQPFDVTADVEAGRPVGMMKGEESVIPLAVGMAGIQFQPGAYRFEARIGDEVIGSASFVCR